MASQFTVQLHRMLKQLAWRRRRSGVSDCLGAAFQLLVLTVLLGVARSEQPPLDDSQMQALERLYSSTDGPNWYIRWNTSEDDDFVKTGMAWDFTKTAQGAYSSDPCRDNWFGVSCTHSIVFELKLGASSLDGTIPPELGQLTGLLDLGLNSNSLVGSIPTELGWLTWLEGLDMSSNSLVGSIPTELGRLTGLQALGLYSNSLVGSIPTELGRIKGLQYLRLSSNSLVGSIPTELGRLAGLEILALNSSSLVGSIPTELGRMTGLQALFLSSNSLDGPIPSELGRMKELKNFDLSSNSLVGYIPSELVQLAGMQQLDLHSNSLVGSIPTELGQLSGLQYLFLSSNSLVGSIPSELGRLTELRGLDLSSNSLMGSLPEQLSNLTNLILLDVHDNNLHGHLSSKLPPSLLVLSLTKNCFTGTLAPSLCEAKSLQYLILDGLSAGDACQIRIWPKNPFGFDAMWSISRVSGSIPACIYSLPNLKLLHVSGNGLRGSLQAGPAGWSANLTDLSLSHNALTGSFPPSLKALLGQLTTLDLSYNRLGGTLYGFHFTSNQSSIFSLDLNRLSGNIPTPVTRMKGTVRVLKGNLFDCLWLDRGTSLPPTDPTFRDYSCGSHSFDMYLFVLASLIALSAASYCILASRWRPMLFWLVSRNKSAIEALLKRPVSVQAVLYRVRGVAALAGAVLLLLFLPLYGALKPFFGTYESQYAWTVTAIMLSGAAPAAVLLVLWTLALAATSVTILYWFSDLKGSTAVTEEVAPPEARGGPTWSERCRLALRLAVIAILNLSVAGAANIAFVVVTVGNYGNAEKSLAAVALGLYKTLWGFLLPFIIDNEALRLGVDRAIEERSKLLKAGDLFCTLLQMINAVVMPTFAVAVSDPSCFKNLLYAPPSIHSSYSLQIAVPSTNWFGSTTTTASGSVDFTPTFSYNYECASMLVEKFAPVFAQVALTSAFVVPLLAVVARWALDSVQSQGLRSFLLAMLPSLLLYRKSERDAPGCLRFLRPKTFIKAGEVLRQSVSDVALMLSIGLVAPLLGIMFAASIVSRCLMWEFLIDRFLSMPDEHIQSSIHAVDKGDLQALEEQCLKLGALGNTALYNARWLLVIFPSLFLALFVANIAGDAAGVESALWAPILMSMLPPVVLFALTRLIPKGNALPTEDCSDARVSFAPSEIEVNSAAYNPLNKIVLLPCLELVEMDNRLHL